ncbi:hypothetical protein ECDEC2B_5296 [Escherichia coli DEC2B]|nr:hypothetical protein ECDEC2B_5296 [Escherichia coli DEC2B]
MDTGDGLHELILPSNSGHAAKVSKLSVRGDSHDKKQYQPVKTP